MSFPRCDSEGYILLQPDIKAGYVLVDDGQRKLSIKVLCKGIWRDMPQAPHVDLELAYNWAWCHCFDADRDKTLVHEATKFIYSGLYALNEHFSKDIAVNIEKYRGCVKHIVEDAFQKNSSTIQQPITCQ